VEVTNGEGQEGTGTYCCANTSMPVEGLDGRAGPVLCVGNAQGSTIRGQARAGVDPPWVAVRWRRVRVSLPLWVRIRPIPLAGVPRPGTGITSLWVRTGEVQHVPTVTGKPAPETREARSTCTRFMSMSCAIFSFPRR
jgi:hypothetical protein